MSKLFRYLNKKKLQRETIAKWKLRYNVKLPLLRDKAKRESKRDIQSSSWGQILWAF